jgi:hypothetical protein
MLNHHIKVNDFEFFYLVELTRQKIKPLSRWEKPLDNETQLWLQHQGFYVESIPRKTLAGKRIYETVFSTSRRCTDLYQRKFQNEFLNNNKQTQSLEGFLFGYPSCCVQQFIRRPYLSNNLNHKQQSLLFHWACPDCRVTPELIPYYQQIHDRISEWHRHTFPLKKPDFSYQRIFQKTAAALLLTSGLLSAQTGIDSTHYIPLTDPTDHNGLYYAEEIYLGTDLQSYSLENCQTYARFFKSIIDTLPVYSVPPDTVPPQCTYKVNHFLRDLRGVVICPKCGQAVNMGYVSLINPSRNLQLDIPYLGIHFMEYGFFTYDTADAGQRVDIDTLKKILYPYDPKHMLSVQNDKDGDGLTDAEEDSLWLEDTAGIPDSNNDGVPDGPQLAEELTRLFPKLKEESDLIHSQVEFNPVWGLENCQICGAIHNMGHIKITNPENKRSCEIPFLSLHALAHGSFAYNGTVHQDQRTDAVELYRVMKTHMLFITEDTDNDGLKDIEEAYFGFDAGQFDSDQDGVADGMELALTMADSIKKLPDEPRTTEPYIEFLDMDGIQQCSVCGEIIPMGVMRIFNPRINTIEPLEITYYAFHFMLKGSFACEGAVNKRIDPITLAQYLDFPTGMDSGNTQTMPGSFELKQNFPNPFNPETVIAYHLNSQTDVVLKVYDLRGKEVKTLFRGMQEPGDKSVIWNGTDNYNHSVSSGIYIYQLTAGQQQQSRKMLFLK